MRSTPWRPGAEFARIADLVLVFFSSLVAVALIGCASDPGAQKQCGAIALDRPMLVLESDFQSSAIARIEGACLTEDPADVALGADSMLVATTRAPLVANRNEGVLFGIDPAKLAVETKYVAHPANAVHANPWDADFDDSGTLWVALFDAPYVALVDAGGVFVGQVDLSSEDSDGVPNMDALRVLDGVAYVAVELLDDATKTYEPKRRGAIIMIDTATRTKTGAFDLAGTNPFGRMTPFGDDPTRFAICTPGDIAAGKQHLDATTGIDVVDVAKKSASLLVSEVELGGFCTETLVASSTEAYAIVAAADNDVNATSLVAFDPSTSKITKTLLTTSGFDLAGLAVDGDKLVVGDRTAGHARVVMLARATGAVLGELVAQELPPWQLLSL